MLKPKTDDAPAVEGGESSMTGRVKAHVDRRVDEIQQQMDRRMDMVQQQLHELREMLQDHVKP